MTLQLNSGVSFFYDLSRPPRKYESSPKHVVYETPSLYRALTLPYLEGERFDHQWIYNVLNHKKEAETIVYEDSDCDDGFILLPDYKVLIPTMFDMMNMVFFP